MKINIALILWTLLCFHFAHAEVAKRPCQAYCGIFRSGPLAQAEIQLSLRQAGSGIILHDDLGVLTGKSTEDLVSQCQALAKESMPPMMAQMGDTLQVVLLESLSVDSNGGLAIVTEHKEFSGCLKK